MITQTFHDPGALNHRISIESIVETSDGCGGVAVSWAPVAEVWASIRPLRQRVFEQALQQEEEQTHKITLRFRDDVSSGWRFASDGRIFEVISATDPDERQRYLVCITREQGR